MAGRSPYRRRTAPRRSSRGAASAAASGTGGPPSSAAPPPPGGSAPAGLSNTAMSAPGAADSLASIAAASAAAGPGVVGGLTSPSAYADAAAASIGAPGASAAGRAASSSASARGGSRPSYGSAGGPNRTAAGAGLSWGDATAAGGASGLGGAGVSGGLGTSFLSDGSASIIIGAGGAASTRRSHGGGPAATPTFGGGIVPGASPAFSTAAPTGTSNNIGRNAAGGVLGTAIPNANAGGGAGIGAGANYRSGADGMLNGGIENGGIGQQNDHLSYSSYSTAKDGTLPDTAAAAAAAAVPSHEDTSTDHLRTLLLSTLQHVIPPSPLNCPTTSSVANAVFFGSMLYARTKSVGDAYLYARALALNGEGRRAVWMLEGAGLLGHPRPVVMPDGKDVGNGNDGGSEKSPPSAALRIEAALLASECMIAAGEWDDALNVMEVVSCYPPPGHRQVSPTGAGGDGTTQQQPEVDYFGLDAHLVLHQIEDGDDTRLVLLADLIRPPAGCVDDAAAAAAADDVPPLLDSAVHPISRLSALLGIVHDELGNPTRSATFLRAALRIDPRNVQALDHCLHRRIMDKDEERAMVLNLSFDGVPGGEFLRDIYLAKLGFAPADAAIVGHENGGAGATEEPNENAADVVDKDKMATDQEQPSAPPTSSNGNKDTTLMSPGVILQQQTPNLTFLGGHGGNMAVDESSIQLEESQMMSPPQPKTTEPEDDERKPAAAADAANAPAADTRAPLSPSDEINRSLVRLTSHPDLCSSSEILSLAAIHSYAKYDLPLTLSYCQLLEKADPYCQNAAYVHISALASLGYKRPLFQLAHRLVDSNPKAAKSWYAVGSYYYACGRFDLAQRHFCRAARLDPRSSECWIAFGCSFAACDESDQALASYRAASRLNPGDHYPLLYMGMEYVRTNHLSLASHFLKSSWRISGNTDPLVRSEMGVLHYRKGEWEDAVTCFVHAVRLVAEMTLDREAESDEAGVLRSSGPEGTTDMEVENDAENTPHGRGRQSIGNPPMTSVRFNMKETDVSTFSHHVPHSNSAPSQHRPKSARKLSDIECIQLCRDAYWEPTIFNLGQSYRKIRMFDEAAACFEKSLSICPGKASSYSALGFTRHLNGDLDGAIEAYHQSLSRKPDDPFCSEMLMRALNESLHYPERNPIFDDEVDASQDESFLSGAGNGSGGGSILSPHGRASSAAASASFMSGHYSDSRMSASASNFTFDSGTDVEMGS